MFAIIETGGKQYKVQEGQSIEIEKLSGEFKEGDQISFDKVLLIDDDKDTKVGTPYLENSLVSATFVKEFKGPKIRIQKYKPKSNYDKLTGHRQTHFEVKINSIK